MTGTVTEMQEAEAEAYTGVSNRNRRDMHHAQTQPIQGSMHLKIEKHQIQKGTQRQPKSGNP